MSCDVQTSSRSASNPNCATASRDFAMNDTSTSAPGLVTSSRRHLDREFPADLEAPTRHPSLAGDPASSTTAGAPCSTDPMSRRSRRTRVEPRSASPTAGAAPGRLRSPRSSPATSSASSSATPAGRRGHALLDTLPAAQDEGIKRDREHQEIPESDDEEPGGDEETVGRQLPVFSARRSRDRLVPVRLIEIEDAAACAACRRTRAPVQAVWDTRCTWWDGPGRTGSGFRCRPQDAQALWLRA